MPEIDHFSRLAVALAIGLMVGIERDWKSREAEEDGRAAGLRTFGLSGLTGGICGVLTESLGAPIVGIAFLAFSGAGRGRGAVVQFSADWQQSLA